MLFQKFQQFMYGRYGGDKFSLFLLVIALVLSLFGALFWPIAWWPTLSFSMCSSACSLGITRPASGNTTLYEGVGAGGAVVPVPAHPLSRAENL